jgi:hypothetical protein
MKTYTEADLALFAKYEAARADLRPAACNPEGPCWVRQGPPAIGHTRTLQTTCIGCGSSLPGLPEGGQRKSTPGYHR